MHRNAVELEGQLTLWRNIERYTPIVPSISEQLLDFDKMTTIIRTLGPEYFLALAITPEGNFGKGRFLMRTAAPKLLADLS